MKLQDLAHDLHLELGEPTDLSPGFIQFWLANNVFKLNSLIGTSYALDSTNSETTVELTGNEGVILKKIYLIYDLDKKIREHLGASGVDTVLEVTSDGGTVRMVNRNEVAKTYKDLKKQEQEELDTLVNSYNINKGGSVYGITGDEAEVVLPTNRWNRTE